MKKLFLVLSVLMAGAVAADVARPLTIGLAEQKVGERNVSCRRTYTQAIFAAGGVPFVLPATTNAAPPNVPP